jgi:hypothetical protein
VYVVNVVILIILRASLWKQSTVLKVLSYGTNTYNPTLNSLHAERVALDNLPSIPRNRRKLVNVSLFVARTNRSGVAGNSKPCEHCIYDLLRIAPTRGYVVRNVHYTDANGCIVSTTLNRIHSEGNFHVTKFYRGVHH